MHKIQEKEFTLEDFSIEHLDGIIANDAIDNIIYCLNFYRSCFVKSKSKDDWWQMIQLLPSSYNQTRNVMMDYEVLANIYKSCKDHKPDEWREFCKWIETLPYSELIIGHYTADENSVNLNRTKYPPYTAEEFLEAIERAHRAFYAKRDNDESC